ncbi:MAG: replicative DNA helicase, partial [Candidatus Omnitrophica bacterium]|nr:replicative DNA helicase [Candidatus Omnitrophota bacterium]
MAEIVKEIVPPQNLDAEMAVLGSMLIDENAIGVAIESVDKSCFYKDSHRIVFEVILSLYNDSKAVDLITLTDELKRQNVLDRIGGVSFLTELVNSV